MLLRKSPYIEISFRAAERLVVFVRSQRTFGDSLQARTEVETWARTVEELSCAELGILLDWRLTPMTSDPEILHDVVTRTDAIAVRFARYAVLLAEPLRPPQQERVERAGAVVPIFANYDLALAHVLGH